MLQHSPQIIDLGMSDQEYLELLAQGRDPVQEIKDRLYETELIGYGISPLEASQVAPLFSKLNCSLEEQIAIGRILKQVWQHIARYTVSTAAVH